MFLAEDLLFVYVLGGNVCSVFKCMLPSGNRDESQKTTAGSLKNSSQSFSNHIKTYWFIGYAIVEYCEAHGAWGMMNFRWDFIGSPRIRKLKWLLYPVQQTACTGFRQVLLTKCDLQIFLVILGMYFHISNSHWGLFFLSTKLHSPLLNENLTGNPTDIYIFLKKASPPFPPARPPLLVLRMLSSEYTKWSALKKSQLFY